MKDMFGDDDSSKKSKTDFANLFESSLDVLKNKFEKGDKVRAEVLTVGKEEVFVSVEGRDGVVSKLDLSSQSMEEVKPGDWLDLFVIKPKSDVIVLSAKPSSKALAESLEDAFDLETPVDGTVTEVVNGGYRVQLAGKLAFCPLSQMEARPVTDPTVHVGKKYEFLITKFEQGGRNIVVSRRRMLDQARLENEGLFMSKVQPGDQFMATVQRIEPFGVFAEIQDGIEGLVHISELSWNRLKHPSEELTVGQKISVKVLKIEEDEKGRLRISLSKKQSEANPLDDFIQQNPLGQMFEGTIKQKERFGLLIELKSGVVGLLPQSQIREAVHDTTLDKKQPGDKLTVLVDRIDPETRRIGLSVPASEGDVAWAKISSQGQQKGLGTLADQFQGLFKNKK